MAASTESARTRPVRPSLGWGPRVRARVDELGDLFAHPLANYYLLIGSCVMLLGLGLLMVLSASSVDGYLHHGNSYYWEQRQVMWLLVGLPAAWVTGRLPHAFIRRLAWPALAISILLMIATQTSLGVRVNGNQNWLALGPFQFQPAELAKFAMVVWGAHVYALKDKFLSGWKHLMVPVMVVFGVMVLLDIAGGDLGTAMVMLAIALGLLWTVGAPWPMFVVAIASVGAGVGTLAVTSPYRWQRITSFLHPFQDFQGTGWQPAHGLLGIASGGLFGRGIGASQQKWGNLPEAHTDFIFAVLGEELGLIGTIFVLMLFAVFAYSGIRVAIQAKDLWVRYTATGIVVWTMAHVLINVGMVLALLPVIGIPLPLVSYGGSSLVTELLALGLLIGFARNDPTTLGALRDRRRARRASRQVSGFNAGLRGRRS
ncbi:MAG: putative lipid II flippase FtsW [Marmoricola sp.]